MLGYFVVGNRALRKKAAALIKLRNISSKLYRNKRIAYDRQNARDLKSIIQFLSYSPGDLINDCDGWNHQISGYRSEKKLHAHFYFGRGSGYVYDIEQYTFTDGRYSCGCGPSDPPKSREEIENFILMHYKGWSGDPHEPKAEKIVEYLEAGGHVCNENGMKCNPMEIPAFPGWK